MCLLFLAVDIHPEFYIVAAANRDEFYARPTRRMHVWEDHDQIIAGRDLERGGTWFGVTRLGRWAAITNFREADASQNGTSRGALVSDYLASEATPESYVHSLAASAHRYSGFNLVVGTVSHAVYFSNRDQRIRSLTKGVYGLSNHLLDTPWPKVRNGKQNLLNLLDREHLDSDSLFSILNDRSPAADEELPDPGMDIEWERLLSSAFISGDAYGTRSSTTLLVNRNNRLKLEERTYGPDSSVCPSGYTSVTHEFDVRYPQVPTGSAGCFSTP